MATTNGPRRLSSDRSTAVVGTRADHSTRARFRRLRRDDGYVLAMVGLLIVPLVIVTAFATDVGQWYAQATKMQRTADAAALAGVVWIGDKVDPNRYITEAQKVATQNGFGNTTTLNGATVTVTVTKIVPNKLRVTINANAMVFFGRVGGVATENLTRSAVAEFNLSVPLGSPRNYLGLGDRGSGTAGTAYEREGLWMAVSGRCTDKAQGDRKAAFTANNGSANNCTGASNNEYSDPPYELYVDLPAGRTYPTRVIIYNGTFSTPTDCTTYSASNPTREFCPGGGLTSGITKEPTTFTLYRADNTPLDDTDNQSMESLNACASTTPGENGTKTFTARNDGLAEHNAPFNPGSGFNGNSSTTPGFVSNAFWNLCTIPQNAPAGRYILRVRPQDSTSGAAGLTHGSNAYGVIADRTATGQLCDQRTDSMCPRVYAKDFLSVYATDSGQPEFFLAEVGAEHQGKVVRITLWDPAEGATQLKIKKPVDCVGGGTWADQTFDWSAPGLAGGTGVSSIDVSGSTFNNKAVTITFRLPASYNPQPCNEWFRIRYTFGTSPTDRTTWALEILGDPVHLIE